MPKWWHDSVDFAILNSSPFSEIDTFEFLRLNIRNETYFVIFTHCELAAGLSFVVGHFLLSKVTHHVTMFLQFLTIWEWSYRSIERWVAKFNQQLPSWKFEYRHVNIIFLLRNFILASGRGVKSFIFPIYALLDFHLSFQGYVPTN